MNYSVVSELLRKSIIAIPVGEGVRCDSNIEDIINKLGICGSLKNSIEKKTFYSYYADMDCYLALVPLSEKETLSYENIKSIYGCFIRESFPGYYENIIAVVPEIVNLEYIKIAQAIYEGIKLGSYVFDKENYCNKDFARSVNLYTSNKTIMKDLLSALERADTLCEGIIMVRNLVNQPGNILYPQSFVSFMAREIEETGITLEVLDEYQLQERNIIGVYSVGKGSINPPRLAILKYLKSKNAPTIALVGKGVTTDLGGINLKIGPNLSAARTDMGGAAAVFATMKTIAALELKANVIAIIPLAENLYGEKSLKPGEVIRYNNNVSVEIRNTDAEGRLILADGILLAREMHADIIVDIATLTGGCANALGSRYAGVMGTDDTAKIMIEAGRKNGEMYWQLPMPDAYKRGLESDIADIGNASAEEPSAITAALFLKEFSGDANWIHIDIAGTRNSTYTYGYTLRGGTGFGVKGLVAFIEEMS